MNKSDLIEVLSMESGLDRKTIDAVVNVVFSSMTDALVKGDRVEIRGFGSFACKEYEARHGRNPKTGAPIHVPAKKLPVFKVGKELRERVNAGGSGS
ncbi:MAG: HU family DNA-binding protein [Myxococcota bacterium]|nr:HU family DNA-binding protein [Myxococcota bacterium]